ncbi:unnamed protein product, partial [Ectocarpus fasciculatus]
QIKSGQTACYERPFPGPRAPCVINTAVQSTYILQTATKGCKSMSLRNRGINSRIRV